AADRGVRSSAPRPAPVVLPAAWPNTAITEGVILEPPRWDTARATATLSVVVPVVSLRNELLGALTAVFDLGATQSRLRYNAGSSPAEVILLAPDGTPLLSTQADATALIRLG